MEAASADANICRAKLLCNILDVNIRQNDARWRRGIGYKGRPLALSCLLLKIKMNLGMEAACQQPVPWFSPRYTILIQSASSFWKFIYSSVLRCFEIPPAAPSTFLIVTAGPWFAILATSNRLYVGLHSVLNELHITQVTRILYALMTSLEKLKPVLLQESAAHRSTCPTGSSTLFPLLYNLFYGGEHVRLKYVGWLENVFNCTTLRACRTSSGYRRS